MDTLTYNEPYIFPVPGLKSNRVIMKPVGDSKNEELFKVYPNPARTFIIVEYKNDIPNENIMIKLIDARGKIIGSYYFKGKSYTIIPLEHLPNGIYFIKLEGLKSNNVKKITINR